MPRPPLFAGKQMLTESHVKLPADLKKKVQEEGLNLSEFVREALAARYGNHHSEATLKDMEVKGRALLDQAAAIKTELEAKDRLGQESLQRELELQNLETHWNDLMKRERPVANEAYRQLRDANKNFRAQGRAPMLKAMIAKTEELLKTKEAVL